MLKKYQISAAVSSIVTGALLLISAISLLITINNNLLVATYSEEILVIMSIALIIISLAVITLGVFFLKKHTNGIPIALIAIIGVIALLEIIGATYGSISVIFYIILCLSTVGLNSVYLYEKAKEEKLLKNNSESQLLTNENNFISQIETKPAKQQEKTISKNGLPIKIQLLMHLRDSGELSETEYKKLLLAELNNQEKAKTSEKQD